MSAPKRNPKTGTWWFRTSEWHEGKRVQRQHSGFNTQRAAMNEQARLRNAANTGRRVAPVRMTYGTYITDRWLPMIAVHPKLSANTREYYRHMSKHLIAHLGKVRIDELTGEHFTALYGTLREAGKGDALLHGVHITASRSLNDAARSHLVGFNAARDAEAPEQRAPQPEAWTPTEVTTLLAAARSNRWWPMWLMFATTAVRRGEACGLRWRDLDLKAGTMTVENNHTVPTHAIVAGPTKTKRARRFNLDPATVEALKVWRKQQAAERLAMGAGWPDTDLVFVWPDGSAVHPNVVTRTFNRIRDRAGVRPLRLHSFRHAWATNALDAEEPITVTDVAERLGNSPRTVHESYVAARSANDARAANHIANLYGL